MQSFYAIRMVHTGHQGIQHAACSMFWYNMTNDITNYVQQCSICQRGQRNNVEEPIMIKPVPQYSFEVVASDLFYFSGSQYILMVDSFSGYDDFVKMDEMTSHSAILFLKRWFSVHGVPKEFHSDNRPQYPSAHFRAFSKTWNFKHITSSPNYPRSNGLAEHYVQTAKNMLKNANKMIRMLIWHYYCGEHHQMKTYQHLVSVYSIEKYALRSQSPKPPQIFHKKKLPGR
jgi:hypothetical protein